MGGSVTVALWGAAAEAGAESPPERPDGPASRAPWGGDGGRDGEGEEGRGGAADGSRARARMAGARPCACGLCGTGAFGAPAIVPGGVDVGCLRYFGEARNHGGWVVKSGLFEGSSRAAPLDDTSADGALHDPHPVAKRIDAQGPSSLSARRREPSGPRCSDCPHRTLPLWPRPNPTPERRLRIENGGRAHASQLAPASTPRQEGRPAAWLNTSDHNLGAEKTARYPQKSAEGESPQNLSGVSLAELVFG